VLLDVGGDLGLQRGREHPAGALTGQLVEHRPTHPRRGVLIGLVLVVDYREHGRTFPNQRVNAGPDQSYLDFRSSSGRCAPSRHRAEDHPQVLIIAPVASRLAVQTSGPRRARTRPSAACGKCGRSCSGRGLQPEGYPRAPRHLGRCASGTAAEGHPRAPCGKSVRPRGAGFRSAGRWTCVRVSSRG